ncbi:unnamed protein product, partial [Eruca vesicaria subsp. sativa]|nr:unnamed protein product [Eruca vesicaria subsp. sativa]
MDQSESYLKAEAEKMAAILSLSEAAKKMDPSHISVYPWLKEVALAIDGSFTDDIIVAKALEQIFTFSLELAGRQGNPALASEATAILINVLKQNVDCFKQWDVLYMEHFEASAALLKKLVHEWKDLYYILSSSAIDTHTVKNALNSFRMKNKKAIAEGVANLSLYKEADKACKILSRKLISWRVSRPPGLAPPLTKRWEETEKMAAILSFSEAAKKIDPSHLSTFLDELLIGCDWWVHEVQISKLWKLVDYYGIALSQISFQSVVNMFEEAPLSKLAHVPLSLIPTPAYVISNDYIRTFPSKALTDFVQSASHLILTEWRRGVVEEVVRPNAEKSKVGTFVVLAMVLPFEPAALTILLTELRDTSKYQGQDTLPVLVWMVAQTFPEDIIGAFQSWACDLLPLVANNEECYSSRSLDFILQIVEMLLSRCPEAPTLFRSTAVGNQHRERLIPPCSFEILVRLTFPAPSARVEKATERFEAIYPWLKEVALATDNIITDYIITDDIITDDSAKALEQIFTFSLELAGRQGNPALASEATAIAISVLTKDVDCFKLWDVLYKEHFEASAALLKKLVDERKDLSHKLSSSSSDTLTVKNALNSFRMKNKKAIAEGVTNLSLYKEADKACKRISRRLSR